jgi:hypothetical protein
MQTRPGQISAAHGYAVASVDTLVDVVISVDPQPLPIMFRTYWVDVVTVVIVLLARRSLQLLWMRHVPALNSTATHVGLATHAFWHSVAFLTFTFTYTPFADSVFAFTVHETGSEIVLNCAVDGECGAVVDVTDIDADSATETVFPTAVSADCVAAEEGVLVDDISVATGVLYAAVWAISDVAAVIREYVELAFGVCIAVNGVTDVEMGCVAWISVVDGATDVELTRVGLYAVVGVIDAVLEYIVWYVVESVRYVELGCAVCSVVEGPG